MLFSFSVQLSFILMNNNQNDENGYTFPRTGLLENLE